MTQVSFRAPALLGLAALATLILGFGLWAALTPLAGAIVASGRIEVERNRQALQHPDGGLVAQVLVAEGDLVQAGQALLRLDGAALHSDLAIVDGRLAELAVRTARLEAERDARTRPAFPPGAAAEGELLLFLARLATLEESRALLSQRLDQTRAQGRGIAAQRAAAATQAALIERELSSQRRLQAKGLVPSATLLTLKREVARLDGQLGELDATLARIEDQSTEIRLQIAALQTLRREEAIAELRQIEPEVRELTERRRALAERIARLDLRAPVGGIVLGLQITSPGAVLRPAEPVLHIVPQDRPLVVTTRIPPIHIDEVHPGQPAELVPTAFSGRDRPRLTGLVLRVSADALTDPNTGTSHYLAEIALDPAATPGLRPGMPVEVYLKTATRTPLAYLTAPLATYFQRAFRES